MFAQLFPGSVVGFREGMEAFLIVGIMLRYLDKIHRPEFKKNVNAGLYTGIGASVLFGAALWGVTVLVGKAGGAVSKLWESGASLLALVFIATFIYWMMRHGKTIVSDVQTEVGRKLSASGLFGLAAIMVLREGAEIALFGFTAVDKQTYLLGIVAGIIIAAVLAYLVNKSLVRVKLGILFNITLLYLVLQAAYMLGYSIHEFLSALADLGKLNAESPWLIQVFDLSGTLFDHKSGAIGLPLNVLIGWYSKPEIVQFILQLGFIAANLAVWAGIRKKEAETRLPDKTRQQ